MCKAFSCIVTKEGKTYYKVGMDSHEDVLEKFGLTPLDDEMEKGKLKFARVEITPNDDYLNPEGKWILKIDERIKPTWWAEEHEKSAYKALTKWKKKIYSSFNLEEAKNPINPLLIDPQEVSQADIDNLIKWDSVRASVWASVGDSVWASVRASVRAYTGSLFPNIEKWEYIEHTKGEYPYQCCVDLWKRGFVPSHKDETWRLHAGKDAHVVYDIKGI